MVESNQIPIGARSDFMGTSIKSVQSRRIPGIERYIRFAVVGIPPDPMPELNEVQY